MKVALLLPGQIREADISYPYIRGRILDRFKPDVFISTWNPSDTIKNSLHAETHGLIDTLTIEEIIKLYSPKHLKTDDFDSEGIRRLTERAWSYEEFGPQTGEINPVSVFLMWYKIKQSFLLMKEYEDLLGERYDCVIKCRMDIKIHNEFPYHPKEGTINIPPGYDWKGGVNDVIAWGDRNSMEHYCMMLDYMEEYILSGVYFHPETLLRHHINSSECNLERPLLKVSLRGTNVWETEALGEEIIKKNYGYIQSRGNFWDT